RSAVVNVQGVDGQGSARAQGRRGVRAHGKIATHRDGGSAVGNIKPVASGGIEHGNGAAIESIRVHVQNAAVGQHAKAGRRHRQIVAHIGANADDRVGRRVEGRRTGVPVSRRVPFAAAGGTNPVGSGLCLAVRQADGQQHNTEQGDFKGFHDFHKLLPFKRVGYTKFDTVATVSLRRPGFFSIIGYTIV